MLYSMTGIAKAKMDRVVAVTSRGALTAVSGPWRFLQDFPRQRVSTLERFKDCRLIGFPMVDSSIKPNSMRFMQKKANLQTKPDTHSGRKTQYCYSPLNTEVYNGKGICGKSGAQWRLAMHSTLHPSHGKTTSKKVDPSMFAVIKTLLPSVVPRNVDEAIRLIVSCASLLLEKGCGILSPIYLGRLVDVLGGVTHTAAVTRAMQWGGAFVGLRVASAGFAELRELLIARSTAQMNDKISRKTVEQLHSLNTEYVRSHQGVEVATMIQKAVRGSSDLMNQVLWKAIPTAMEFGLVMGFLALRTSPGVVISALSTLSAYLLFTFSFTRYRTQLRWQMNAAEEHFSGALNESISHLITVRTNNAENIEQKRLEAWQLQLSAARANVKRSLAMLNFGQKFLYNLGLFYAMMWTVRQAANGMVPVGDCVVVVTMLQQLANPLNFIGSLYRETRGSLTSIGRWTNFVTHGRDRKTQPSPSPYFKVDRGDISIKNVWFSYATRRDTSGAFQLQDISLEIRGGESIALVGPSGSGKSTLLRLLAQVMRPSLGTLMVDGVDTATLPPWQVRESMASVLQDDMLFNSSAAYNILLGNPEIPQDHMKTAARDALIHDRIARFPHQYYEPLGDFGSKLSGGEQQRVHLARCFLRNKKIMLLDEATSSLDAITEILITQRIAETRADRTVVIAAHRITPLRWVDRIVYMKDGRIVEQGTLEELLALDGEFATLWRTYYEGKVLGPPSGVTRHR